MVDLQSCAYFHSLPKLLQESIMQTGVRFNTEEELRKFVSNIDASRG